MVDKAMVLTEEITKFTNLAIEGQPFTLLTGPAGTGKSTALRHLVSKLSNTRVRYVILSPTALAAINVGGQTIHSFFKLPIGIIHKSNLRVRREALDLYAKLDLMIIDEISMVRADLLDAIDHILRMAKKNHKPVGGVRVVAIGDPYQLSPIISREEEAVFGTLYKTSYFFGSNIFKDVVAQRLIKTVDLTRVFRQSDEDFINVLHRIRTGRCDIEDLCVINSRHNGDVDDAIMLCSTNAIKHTHNKLKIGAIDSQEYVFEAKMAGGFVGQGENNLPSPANLVLKIGVMVVFTKNNPTAGYFNGMLGRVESISGYDTNKPKIAINIDGVNVVVEKEGWHKHEYGYDEKEDKISKKTVGKFEQFPLDLGYAVTIHKSQGQTFERAVINMGSGAFCHGQAYVALSRCRTLEGLSLIQKIRPRDIMIDQEVHGFYDSLGSIDNAIKDDFF